MMVHNQARLQEQSTSRNRNNQRHHISRQHHNNRHNNQNYHHHHHHISSTNSSNDANNHIINTYNHHHQQHLSDDTIEQANKSDSISICYSYLIAILSSFLVVLGVYLSLTKFNARYLYISLAGILLEALSAFIYCISNIRQSRSAHRKQNVRDIFILDNNNNNNTVIQSNLLSSSNGQAQNRNRQTVAENGTEPSTTIVAQHVLTNRSAAAAAAAATNASALTNPTAIDPKASTSSIITINQLLGNETIDNNSTCLNEITNDLRNHGNGDNQSIESNSTLISVPLQQQSSSSPSTQQQPMTSSSRQQQNNDNINKITLLNEENSTEQLPNADDNNSIDNTKHKSCHPNSSPLPTTSQTVLLTHDNNTISALNNDIEKNSSFKQMRVQTNIDNSETTTTTTTTFQANPSADSQQSVDDLTSNGPSPLSSSSSPSSTQPVGRRRIKNALTSGRNSRHSSATRRTLVMGLSGEEEVIEINEDDLDNMSAPPPPYESIATTASTAAAEAVAAPPPPPPQQR